MTRKWIVISVLATVVTLSLIIGVVTINAKTTETVMMCDWEMKLPGQSPVCYNSYNVCFVQYDESTCSAYFWSGDEIVVGEG